MQKYLKYARSKLFVILSCLFKSMFIHGYIPEKMLISVIVPVVKNKNTSLCIKKNYRPVTLSSAMSKVFEYIVLSRIEKTLKLQIISLYLREAKEQKCVYLF